MKEQEFEIQNYNNLSSSEIIENSMDQFVEILKETTQAKDINIYTRDLVQIFHNYDSIC